MKKNEITYPQLLVGGSVIGLVASFWSATERIQMLKYPTEPLSCSLNPIVDCGGVLDSSYAAVFGPPNTFIGMVVFALLLGFGLQRLSGGDWTRLIRFSVVVLSLTMLAFSLWFFAISVYTLGKICLFCIFIWFVTIPMAVYGVKDFFEHEKKFPRSLRPIGDFVTKFHLSIVVFIYAAMIVLYLLNFQDYYFG